MKPKLQDYLLIAGALLAIFVSGYGIGFLFGERKGLDRTPPAGQSTATWEERTLHRLSERLELTSEQSENVAREIRASAADIRDVRANAVRESQRVLLDLHNRIETHLNVRQRELLLKDKRDLEEALQAE